MSVTMELPLACSTETEGPKLFTGHAEASTDAAAAEQLLTGRDSQEEGNTQREICIVLVRDVEDAVTSFHAKKGDTLTAVVDEEGDVYLPFGETDVYLEAEEFEVVEPVNDVVLVSEPVTAGTDSKPEQPAKVEAEKAEPAAENKPQQAQDTKPADARAKYFRQKSDFEEQIGAACIELENTKRKSKKLKKEIEYLTEELEELINDWENGRDDEDDGKPAAVVSQAPAPTVTESSQPQTEAEMRAKLEAAGEPTVSQAVVVARDEAAEQERYKQVLQAAKVEELGLPPKVTERLQEANATTIWALEQLRAEISLGKAKWPKGIGVAKVTDIEDALMNWMARNQKTWAANQQEAIAASHPQPRTPEQIEASNRELEAKQDAERAAEVSEDYPAPEPATYEQPQSVDDLLASL